MSQRTSTVTRKLSVLSAPGRSGRITLSEGKDADYDGSVYQHDAAQLFDTLRYLLPTHTWAHLCYLIERMP